MLHFTPCIEDLIDNSYCQRLSEMLYAEKKHWEQHKAVPGLGAMLPDEAGLYMFVWEPRFTLRTTSTETSNLRWVLYIGKAGGPGGKGTIRNRYTSEYSKYVGQDPSPLWDTQVVTKRDKRLARYLTLRPLDFWFLPIDDVQEIERLERKLIKLLRPPLNDQHGAKLRAGNPIPVT